MQIAAEPFRVAVEDSVLEDLKTRLARTRWPNEPEGGGWLYGTDLTYLKQFVDRWQTGYDWRHWEAELNRFPQYRAEIDGLKLHFIVEPGSGDNPLPLILTHGWPGSVFEFHKIIEPLAHPERFGGDPNDAFTVIAPSLPGKTGVPDCRARRLHEILSPSRPIASGLGPMNSISQSRHTSAKCAFSARKP